MQSSGDGAGTATVSWAPISAVLDPTLGAGQQRCRLDLQFIRRGIDQPAPMIAGRAPDRVGVAFFLPVTDANGRPLVRAGDRLVCIADPNTGRLPVFGTFEIRTPPDVAQDMLGGHHVEVQIVEVAESNINTTTPYPFTGAVTSG